jgi:hypothetical protein
MTKEKAISDASFVLIKSIKIMKKAYDGPICLFFD